MILVAGGTGRLGSLLVTDLVDRGETVRVLTRDPARAVHLARKGIDVVRGDVCDRASLTEAFRGVSVVVSAIQGFAGKGKVTPESVDHRGNVALIDAAAAVGAEWSCFRSSALLRIAPWNCSERNIWLKRIFAPVAFGGRSCVRLRFLKHGRR